MHIVAESVSWVPLILAPSLAVGLFLGPLMADWTISGRKTGATSSVIRTHERRMSTQRSYGRCAMRQDRRKAKARQTSKLTEIRDALLSAGYDTTPKQAAALGLGRSTVWVVLNADKRAGPSATVVKRILSSPNLPKAARQKVEEYVKEKSRGLYGHSERRSEAFRDQLSDLT